jgi:hypothetical protein
MRVSNVMKIKNVLVELKNHWKLGIALLSLIAVIPIIVYILVIIPFPSAHGINRDAWVGFFGNYFGGITGGLCSVIGVFLTLNYYRDKDNIEKIKDESKKLEERDFLKKSRDLNVRPYLRIIKRTSEQLADHQIVYSDSIWTPFPEEIGHPFWLKLDINSG